jgi:glycosyltransferase involved in cell wall biosynthesis
MSRVCFVTTTPFIANAFLEPHLLALSALHDLTLATNLRDGYSLAPAIASRLRVEHLPIARRPAPLQDARALALLRRLFQREGFRVVHTVAPKAGLLGMLAAYSAGVPVRVHTFQGEVWASRRGPMRSLLRAADQVVGQCATDVLVVSRGEQQFLEREGVLQPQRSTVLGAGSIAGVDTARFQPNARLRRDVRARLGIGADDFVVLYLGRLGREKGVLHLREAFERVQLQLPRAHLVFAGPDEERLATRLAGPAVQLLGQVGAPESYIAAADVLCLPSLREGFGVTLIEAGACGVPVLASRLYGTQDAVVEGQTGLFHEPGDSADLARKLLLLAGDAALRQRLGRAGRARAEAEFRQERLVGALRECYARW